MIKKTNKINDSNMMQYGLKLKQYKRITGKINKALSIINKKNQLSPFCFKN